LSKPAAATAGALSTPSAMLWQSPRPSQPQRDPVDRGEQLHPFSLVLGQDGLHLQSARGESLLKWSAVAFVKRNKDYIFIGVTPYTFFLIPMRMFQSPQESEEFWVRMCDRWRESAQEA
jgi:hypothetical protein